MIFVKFSCLMIKSKLAVNGRSVRPVKKLDASALLIAIPQPSMPPASLILALTAVRLAGEMVCTFGHPVRVDASL